MEVWEWYEDKQQGLGDRFKQELYKRIKEIELHPDRYPIRKKPYHETTTNVFPYLNI